MPQIFGLSSVYSVFIRVDPRFRFATWWWCRGDSGAGDRRPRTFERRPISSWPSPFPAHKVFPPTRDVGGFMRAGTRPSPPLIGSPQLRATSNGPHVRKPGQRLRRLPTTPPGARPRVAGPSASGSRPSSSASNSSDPPNSTAPPSPSFHRERARGALSGRSRSGLTPQG